MTLGLLGVLVALIIEPAMDAPPVQYVKTSDGYRIAYAVSGAGRPFLFAPNQFSHIQMDWDESSPWRTWFEMLAHRFRLVQVDWRGQGMSQRGLASDHVYPRDLRLDLEAVTDRLGPIPVVLMGVGGPAYAAIRFAVDHPERVAALVLISTSAGAGWSRAMFSALPEEHWELFLRSQVSGAPDGSEDIVARLKQMIDQRDWITRNRQWPPTEEAMDAASALRVPTLVLYPRGRLQPGEEAARELAALIPGARLVMVTGAFVVGDYAESISAIEAFLAELPEVPRETAASSGLSSREVEVLRLVAAGKSNAQIADELVISQNTVIRHVSNIFAKTGAANRAQAAVYAKDHGLA
jgi:pimeloyl-ACP methyl ester carboxylesterase/DNA-binding CsgD family transcriptional regulator